MSTIPAAAGPDRVPPGAPSGSNAAWSLQPPDVPPAEGAELTISADRPSFTDGCGFVPAGHFELDTGFTFTFRNRDDVETQKYNGPEILARLGLIEDRLEIRFLTSGYVWSRSNSGAGFAATDGMSDVALAFKLKLLDQDGAIPRLCFEALTTLGTGSVGISSRKAEPTLKVLWSYDLHNSVVISGNLNVAFPTTNGDRFTQGQASLNLSWSATDRLSLYAEYYVLGPNSKGSDAAHYADFGVGYLLTKRIQLDARVGFGLNQEADNFFTGAGISFLF